MGPEGLFIDMKLMKVIKLIKVSKCGIPETLNEDIAYFQKLWFELSEFSN